MKKILALSLCLPGPALAHPGHGLPGWIHPHAADYALIAFGVFVVSAGLYLVRKALKR